MIPLVEAETTSPRVGQKEAPSARETGPNAAGDIEGCAISTAAVCHQ